MGMKVHELHPMLVHSPLTLLPMAAGVDLWSSLTGRKSADRLGASLWWAGAASGLLAGLAGLAASQEVSADNQEIRDRMFLHGAGNVALVLSAFGMAAWRMGRRPSLIQALIGTAACGAAVYTAYLGGELVYHDGAGVKRGRPEANRPELLSRKAAPRLAADTVRGLRWLFERAFRLALRREPLAKHAAKPNGVIGAPALAHPLDFDRGTATTH